MTKLPFNGPNEGYPIAPSESFGPYVKTFDQLARDVRSLSKELTDHRIEMAGFKGKIIGAALIGSGFVSFIVSALMGKV